VIMIHVSHVMLNLQVESISSNQVLSLRLCLRLGLLLPQSSL
jgi:hypothetical protein